MNRYCISLLLVMCITMLQAQTKTTKNLETDHDAYYVVIFRENGVDVEYHFYGLAALVGLVMGGIQSLSRSTYSKLMPPTKDTASFFSFYDILEKISIVVGTFLFGYLNDVVGSKRSLLLLIVFFVMGLALLFVAHSKSKFSKELSALRGEDATYSG